MPTNFAQPWTSMEAGSFERPQISGATGRPAIVGTEDGFGGGMVLAAAAGCRCFGCGRAREVGGGGASGVSSASRVVCAAP